MAPLTLDEVQISHFALTELVRCVPVHIEFQDKNLTTMQCCYRTAKGILKQRAPGT